MSNTLHPLPTSSDSDGFTDVIFGLCGSAITPAYAVPLWQALRRHLPWLDDEPDAAILPLARLGSGQGAKFIGRHTRLELRLPRRRVDAALALCGLSLHLGDEERLEVGSASLRPLRPAPVQYSSFVALGSAAEAEFLVEAGRLLEASGIEAHLICGKAQTMPGEHEAGVATTWPGFSLMLHGLTLKDSLRIQGAGLGLGRKFGYGVFMPHKSVVAVGAD